MGLTHQLDDKGWTRRNPSQCACRRVGCQSLSGSVVRFGNHQFGFVILSHVSKVINKSAIEKRGESIHVFPLSFADLNDAAGSFELHQERSNPPQK
jgi:hypothetical protein